MTQEEMIVRLGPIPHRLVPGDKLQVMDLSQLPGAYRSLFDAQGFFIGGDGPESVVAEPGVSEIIGGEIPARDKNAPPQGKLPEDFPGFTALDTAGIHTYAQLRKAGDVTEVPGIGEVTAGKIAEALG